MKKILAILLAMMLVLSMGFAAFAEEDVPSTSTTIATMGKVVVISGEDAKMPAETFSFSISNESVSDAAAGITTTDMPTPTLGTVSYAEGGKGEEAISINLPTYSSVGIYTYKITENAGDTAGMTYAPNSYTLKVTVVNDEENGGFKVAGTILDDNDNKKHDTFTNTYSAGKLTVTKTVEGALGDKTSEFDFSVTFNAPEGKTVNSTISYNNGTEEETFKFDGKTKTVDFSLKHEGTITFKNLPDGVTYTVTETDYSKEGYTTTKTGDTGTIVGGETKTAAFTNTKDGTIDTGITTDSLPYIMLLGFVVLAGAAMLLKRRAARHN